ncbi:MAG: S8 family serine peptidase [Candidatus Eisenbacteria bacterium]|nr:S8 family serine peptidase [Candidatus Eisenbacteria bacterium]
MRIAFLLLLLAPAVLAPRPAAAARIAHDERVSDVTSTPTPVQADPGARMGVLGLRRGPSRPGFGAAALEAVGMLVLGEPSEADISAAGGQVISSGPGFRTVRLPWAFVPALASVPGVRVLQASRPFKPELDMSAAASGAVLAHGASAPPYPATGFTGRQVVLGLVDSGIDWTHGDFKDAAGHSRILHLWDQTDAFGPAPALYPYGTEWVRADLEAVGGAREVDVSGHGTHVAGIAAGNGAATGNGKPAYTYVGVAPEADIVAVKSDFSTTGVVDAVNWIFQKSTALGRDAVVNLSLGSNYGPHDGTDPQEIALDALSGPGRLIVKAAGNTGGERIHGRVDVGPRRTATLSWAVSPYTASYYNYNFFDLECWYSEQDSLTVTLMSPNGQVLGPIPVGYYTPSAVSTPDGALYVENGVQATQNGLRHLFIEVWDPMIGQEPAAGTWTLRVDNARALGASRLDAWLAGYNLGDGQGAATMQAGWNPEAEITTPGSARRVITVGAYSTKSCWNALGHTRPVCYITPGAYGSLAFFSSPGPTRDGRMKPDITAPGFGVAAALSGSVTMADGYTVDDGVHVIQQGTSMSAPHVAGALCLLLQKFPHMGPDEALSRLALGALRDSATGPAPNDSWGYGKLNVARSLATPVDVPGVIASGRPAVALFAAPNPFRGATRVRVDFAAPGAARVRVLDVSGRCLRTLLEGVVQAGPREFAWDGTSAGGARAPSGIYWVEARQGGSRALRKLGLVR